VSEENVEIVRRALDPLSEGGVEAMMPFVHDRFEMTTPSEMAAEPDTYRGRDGIRRWFESFYEVTDRVHIDGENLAEVGEDQVVASLRLTARGGSTGIEATQEAEVLCSLAEGKVRRMSFYPGRPEALAAAAGPRTDHE
jgi:ketosteroid isomerase-like protein